MDARFSIATPTGPSNAPGAIAIIQIIARDAHALDDALLAICGIAIAPGDFRVRRVLGVDECVVARWTQTVAHVMPHAGKAVMLAMTRALEGAGLQHEQHRETGGDPRGRFPEARDLADACLCDALAHAVSPLAVDVLPIHAQRWRDRGNAVLPEESAHARALHRVIEPALVVAWGYANVGKSSLVNALAGRSVSIVADQPGTTRDAVGVSLELDGLVVRWLDAPGVRSASSKEDHAATEIAAHFARRADLVVMLGDAGSGFAEPPPGCAAPILTCATREDIGSAGGARVSTSVRERRGLADLAVAVRRELVPDSALETRARWRFHPWLDRAV